MSKVYLFLANGFEEIEALAVVDLLRRAKIDTETVSIADTREVTGRSNITVLADIMYEDAKPETAAMMILPGGLPGTTYLMEHEDLKKQLIRAYEEGRYVAAICAAPTVLAAHGILDGKQATCYPGLEGKLTAGGAEATDSIPVVRDGNVITSRGAGTAILFGCRLIEVLKDKETADAVRDGIVYSSKWQ